MMSTPYGDVVLLKDLSFRTQQWPMSKVVRTFPGDEGLVRVVELRCRGMIYKRPVQACPAGAY